MTLPYPRVTLPAWPIALPSLPRSAIWVFRSEHYLQSGLNNIPTSVMTLADCIAVATGERRVKVMDMETNQVEKGLGDLETAKRPKEAGSNLSEVSRPEPEGQRSYITDGQGLPSQGDFSLVGEAFITDAPITFLGFVDRETGIVREPGHPADGQSLAGKIAIFPKGSGSTVAPYVLLELFYRDRAPIAVINTEIDQQSAPACSLEGIPYVFDVDPDIFHNIRNGDQVEIRRRNDQVTISRIF